MFRVIIMLFCFTAVLCGAEKGGQPALVLINSGQATLTNHSDQAIVFAVDAQGQPVWGRDDMGLQPAGEGEAAPSWLEYPVSAKRMAGQQTLDPGGVVIFKVEDISRMVNHVVTAWRIRLDYTISGSTEVQTVRSNSLPPVLE